MHFKGKTPHSFQCELQVCIAHWARLTHPWWISWDQTAYFQIFTRDQALKEGKPSLVIWRPQMQHWSLASLRKLSLRVCMGSDCLSDTPPFLNLQFGCEINATVVWLPRKFCNDRSSDFSSSCTRSRTVAWDFVSSCTSFQLQQMSDWLTGWQGDLKTAIGRRLCQIARAFADVLLWESCIEAAESTCNNNDSFVAAQFDDSYNRMEKHSQTTFEEICRPWLPVPPSKICGQDIWREDMCRCWVGFSTVCQRCCSLVLSFGFVTEPSASCVRSWSYCLSELVFLEGELSMHAWSACCMG